MKKLILTFAAACCMMSAGAQAPRMTLHQEFTGENCGPCAGINPGFWTLCNSNASKLIHITYMEPIPSTGSFYNETMAMSDALATYYNVPFAPYGRFDGVVPDGSASYPGEPNYFVQSDIDAESALTSPFTISAVHYFNAKHDSVYGIVTITAASAYGGTQLKLKAAFTRSMNFATAPGANGETDFENVVRNMFPDNTGQAIASSWTSGSSHVYKYAGKLTGMETTLTGYTQVDSNFVIWIQNDSAGSTPTTRNYQSVLQAAKSVYRAGALGVPEIKQLSQVSIYPNPAKGSATVSFSLEQAAAVHIKVMDELGRTFNAFSRDMDAGAQKIELPAGSLPEGMYLIQLQANSDVVTERLSVIR